MLEGNALTATIVFAAAAAIDAFTAVDAIGRDGPTSLRMTAMVLVVCLASPDVTPSSATVQRGVVATVR